MSDILIAYTSKNKTTARCALMLREKLGDADIVNLCRTQPDISGYKTVVIGSGIQFNIIHEKCTEFMKTNLDALMKKQTAIFICCGFTEKANQYLLHNFPRKLLDRSLSVQCFGGSFRVHPLKLADKYVIKWAIKTFKGEGKSLPEIDVESIEKMVHEIKKHR